VGLLTLSGPLRADVHGGFHSIDTDPMVALFFSAASLSVAQLSMKATIVRT
jgi:hypothetical protein